VLERRDETVQLNSRKVFPSLVPYITLFIRWIFVNEISGMEKGIACL